VHGAECSLLPAFRSPDSAIISTGSGNNFFDVAQLQANSSVDENSTALRLDYRFNTKHSAYFRFFRDQGTNDQPEGVTGRRVLIKAVPQNGVLALQSLRHTDTAERIQVWLQQRLHANQRSGADDRGFRSFFGSYQHLGQHRKLCASRSGDFRRHSDARRSRAC
jgi:hypothetical protein